MNNTLGKTEEGDAAAAASAVHIKSLTSKDDDAVDDPTCSSTTEGDEAGVIQEVATASSPSSTSVAERAAWLKNSAFGNSTSSSRKPTATTNDTKSPTGGVSAKMKWLESAFSSENDGKKNMKQDEREVTTTNSGSVAYSIVTNRTPTSISPRNNNKGEIYYLDKTGDEMEWAYEVWFQKGFLPWRSTTFQKS